jgi:hypothetical protein
MFTIFDLSELIGAVAGFGVGVLTGWHWFGWPGVILGGVVGLVAGWIFGRVPFAIAGQFLRRNLARCDNATLRSRLDTEYYIAHIIIAHLVIRGEPIESFRGYVAGLLNSDCPDRRRIGEYVVRVWPQTAEPIQSTDSAK